jgi:hypothetical protein
LTERDENIAEEKLKAKSHGRSERHFILRMKKELLFVRRFPDLDRPSF